jgi:uncharacterized protein DUF899
VSAFALEDGVVCHTYSAYERGVDGLWSMYQWLDRAPLGRNETGFWWRRHDEYPMASIQDSRDGIRADGASRRRASAGEVDDQATQQERERR